MQRIEHLHIGKAIEEDDAVDELVGMFHLFDGFLAPLLGERLVAPVAEQPVMQPVLIDRRQLVPKRLVEVIDDARLALHVRTPAVDVGSRTEFGRRDDYSHRDECAKTMLRRRKPELSLAK